MLVLGTVGVAGAAKPDLDLELRNALDTPVGGKAYTQIVDESYTASLGFTASFKVANDVSIGPCVEVDGQPVHADKTIFNAAAGSQPNGPERTATLGRARGLGGARLTVRGNHVELWLRIQAGVDSIDGKVTQPAVAKTMAMAGPTVHVHSTVFAIDPELALVVPISRAFIGFGFSVPVALNHSIAPLYGVAPNSGAKTPPTPRGDSIDLEFGLLAGVRL